MEVWIAKDVIRDIGVLAKHVSQTVFAIMVPQYLQVVVQLRMQTDALAVTMVINW